MMVLVCNLSTQEAGDQEVKIILVGYVVRLSQKAKQSEKTKTA
jgi:hypothetical protein